MTWKLAQFASSIYQIKSTAKPGRIVTLSKRTSIVYISNHLLDRNSKYIIYCSLFLSYLTICVYGVIHNRQILIVFCCCKKELSALCVVPCVWIIQINFFNNCVSYNL